MRPGSTMHTFIHNSLVNCKTFTSQPHIHSPVNLNAETGKKNSLSSLLLYYISFFKVFFKDNNMCSGGWSKPQCGLNKQLFA